VKLQADSLPGQPTDLLSAAAQVAASRGWKVRDKSSRRLEINTSPSIGSLGETLKVTVVNDPSAPGTCIVKVSSSARFQALDRGRSEDNIGAVLSGMRQLAHGGRVAQPLPEVKAEVKFCASCGTRMPLRATFCPGCGERQ
jgi:hypothetical protein